MKNVFLFLFLSSVFIKGFSQQYSFAKDNYGNITAKDTYGTIIAKGVFDYSGNFVWKDVNGNIIYTLIQNSNGSVTQKDKYGNIISVYEKSKSAVENVLEINAYKGNAARGGGVYLGIDLSQAFNSFNKISQEQRNYNSVDREEVSVYRKQSNAELFRERERILINAFLAKETNRNKYKDLIYQAWGLTDFDGLSSYYLSQFLLEENSFSLAQEYINAALKKNGKDADYLALKSYVELKLNNMSVSKKFYDKAFKKNKISLLKYNFPYLNSIKVSKKYSIK